MRTIGEGSRPMSPFLKCYVRFAKNAYAHLFFISGFLSPGMPKKVIDIIRRFGVQVGWFWDRGDLQYPL